MKNLIFYVFGFALCAFLNHLTWSEIALQNGSGNVFANTLFLLGAFSCACGIVVETFKLVLKLINPVK